MSNRNSAVGRRVTFPLLVSLFLGAPAVVRGDPITEAEAIDQISRLGGRVKRNEKLSDRPVALVRMNRDTIGDEQLIWLKPLTSLTTLDLSFSKVTDEGLRPMREMANLRSLRLYKTRITRAAVAELQEARPELSVDRK